MKLVYAECDVQKACIDLLSARGFRIMPRDADSEREFPAGTIWRNNSGCHLVRDGGRPRMIRYGLVGSADNLGWISGSARFIAIEMKRPGNKLMGQKPGTLSSAQRKFLTILNDHGGVGLAVWDVAKLSEVLDTLGRYPAARFDIKGNVVGGVADAGPTSAARSAAEDEEIESPF